MAPTANTVNPAASATVQARKIFDHDGIEEWIHMGSSPEQVAAAARADGLELVRMVCYGIPRPPVAPASCLHGAGCRPAVHAWCVKGAKLHPVRYDHREVGVWYEVGGTRRLHLGGIRPLGAAAPEVQAQEVFDALENILRQEGFTFHDVLRTWFHLDQILDWYDAFNRVRTGFFLKVGVLGGRLPASTGVGVANLHGGALSVDALAMAVPEKCALRVSEVTSPWQGPATAYGSSFSRAMLVESPALRHLTISGTAAIDPQGKTMHVGDQPAQIEDTLEGVGALLEKAGFGWGDVVRAVFYTPGGTRSDLALARLSEIGLDTSLCAVCGADVCRDDLLFELEVEAVREGAGGK